jgi:hypothetical protein
MSVAVGPIVFCFCGAFYVYSRILLFSPVTGWMRRPKNIDPATATKAVRRARLHNSSLVGQLIVAVFATVAWVVLVI